MLRMLLAAVAVCCLLAETVAQPDVRIGFEERYKNGLWTPVTVKSPTPIETLAIQSSDSDGTPITYRYNVDNLTQTTVLAKLGRKNERIQVAVNSENFIPFDVPVPVSAERPIYLIFGNGDIGLQGAVAELMLREDRRPLLVQVNSMSGLPAEWFGYEAVEMVVLTTAQPELFDGLTINSPQIQALNDWLRLGGKMLLCAGRNAEQFLEDNETGWLRLFLPGRFDGMTELRNGSPFERFASSQRQIFMNGTADAPFMRMPRIAEPDGLVFVQDGDLPLVLRSAHGLGTLYYFAGDLSERPLANWRDRTLLVRSVMQWNTVRRTAVDPRSGAMLHLGYNDISGQIRSALDRFDGVSVVPFSVILIILTAYWLVIGLLDWYLVHKILKKPMLTWITFPCWIVLFSFAAYILAAPGRPHVEKQNALTLLDVDAATGIGRASLWVNVYSPMETRFTAVQTFVPSGHFSWFGLPGSGLGGMAPNTVSPPVWQTGSEQVQYDRIVNVPIQTRSTKSFFGQHQLSADHMFVAQLSDDEGVPVGTLSTPEDYPLKNCILVYGRWVLELGDIAPGQTVRITKTTPRRDLRDLLIPPQTLENENLRRLATYNPQSVDLEYIVRVMSLHSALGGFESTGLHHAFQSSLDLSGLLSVDRALLLGTIPADLALVIIRASLPIELTPTSPRWGRERRELLPDALDSPIRPGFIEVP